jgi:hypothetical protein
VTLLANPAQSPPVMNRCERTKMKTEIDGILFKDYKDESQLDSVMELVGRDLSEPYSSKF